MDRFADCVFYAQRESNNDKNNNNNNRAVFLQVFLIMVETEET